MTYDKQVANDLFVALSELVEAADKEHRGELGVDTTAAINRASALLARIWKPTIRRLPGINR